MTWQRALGLIGGERFFTLGFASDEPDWRYFRDQCAGGVREELVKVWQQVAGSPPLLARPRAQEILSTLLPPHNYRVSADPPDGYPALRFGQVVVGCDFVETPIPPEFRSARAQGLGTADRLLVLQNYRNMLLLGEQPAAERTIANRFFVWEEKQRTAVLKTMVWGDEPSGWFRWLRMSMEQAVDYFDVQGKVSVMPARGVQSFPENIKRVLRRERRMPAWGSVWLRLGLIAVGSLWTVWGTLFWATGRHPWNDAGMAEILGFSLAGLLLLVFLAVGQVVWGHASLLRAERFAQRDILSAYLAHLLQYIARRIKSRTEVLRDEFRAMLITLEKLPGQLIEKPEGPGPVPENLNPRFSVTTLRVVIDRMLPELVKTAHRAVASAMMSDSRWPLFDAGIWRERVASAVESSVDEHLGRMTHEAAVQAAGWTEEQRQRLVAEMMVDAGRSRFPEAYSAPDCYVMIGTEPMQATARLQPNFWGYTHDGRDVRVIAVVPLRQPALCGEGEG
jgi:hypothetical protein